MTTNREVQQFHRSTLSYRIEEIVGITKKQKFNNHSMCFFPIYNEQFKGVLQDLLTPKDRIYVRVEHLQIYRLYWYYLPDEEHLSYRPTNLL